MFKKRAVKMSLVKDVDGQFHTLGTDYVTAVEVSEAAAHRLIDHAVKAAVTIILVQGIVRTLAK